MIGKKQELRVQILQLVDSLLILLSFWVARVVRDSLAVAGILSQGVLGSTLSDILWILFIVVPFSPIILENYGFYNHPMHKLPWDSVRQMFQTLLVLVAIVAVGVIFFQLNPSSRLTLAGALPVAASLLLLRESLTRATMKRRMKQGERLETVVLAGSPDDVQALRARLPRGLMTEWRVADVFDLDQRPVSELSEILHRHSAARVLFAAGHTSFNRVQEGVRACEVEGVEAWVHANFLETRIARPTFDNLGDQPMLVFRSTPEVSWAMLFKDVFDRLAAGLSLCVLGLPMVAVALGIKLASPGGPVLFRQQRAGRHGTPFQMLKFRTMVPDADKLLDQVKEESGNEMDGPVFKLDNDPRIFPLGRFLRKFSIDELPQLWNVLKGEMSMVGPRPLPVYEVEQFEHMAHRRRLSVKPGLTCLWQISGRNQITSFEDWVRLDLDYIDRWSLWLDFKILAQTIPVVLLGKGAK